MTSDDFTAHDELRVGAATYRYHSLPALAAQTGRDVAQLPMCLKVLLENALRGQRPDDVQTLLDIADGQSAEQEISFAPARVMMDDTAGLPLLGDLAAMRDAVVRAGGHAQQVAPAIPVDFIVDHSVIAEHAGRADARARNEALEFARNQERFAFLRWAGQAFEHLRVVPPGNGICHQINLEYLAEVVRVEPRNDGAWLVPDTLVGIDSHTPMINALGVVGWGVSGIEGVAAALGEPVSLRVPRVVGVELVNALRPGITATDLVLTLVQTLRRHGVVGAFVEYFGSGVTRLPLPARATLANMTPECGATMSYFPIDAETLRYLRQTGRDAQHVARVEAYARAQGLWHDAAASSARYNETLHVDLAAIEPSLAGPSQPHHRIGLSDTRQAFARAVPPRNREERPLTESTRLRDGDVVIAAITSCTNTSNPEGMLGAGLLARNAVRRGLAVKPWVKTSLSPGSRVVADYLRDAGLQESLDALGFHVTGFGCMTCVGFSGALADDVQQSIEQAGVAAAAVVSGNRNYDGRIHAQVTASFLASPPLVVAYALAGSMNKDLGREPLGSDEHGHPVYLRELWPDADEVARLAAATIDAPLFARAYASLYAGSARWRALAHTDGAQFTWEAHSSFIRPPPEFAMPLTDGERATDLCDARILAIYGDDVTTEHVSPMGPIPRDSLAAGYLQSIGVAPHDLGTYAARRLIADVMARGTYATPHLINRMTPERPGGHTRHQPDGTPMTIFDAAQRYCADDVPLVVIAGARYGTGSSRDWSAKGPRALGVRAVLAGSFERLHRANLVAAGVLPLQFEDGAAPATFDGSERVSIEGIAALHAPRARLCATVKHADGTEGRYALIACVETYQEVAHYRAGGTYRYLLRQRSGRPTCAATASAE